MPPTHTQTPEVRTRASYQTSHVTVLIAMTANFLSQCLLKMEYSENEKTVERFESLKYNPIRTSWKPGNHHGQHGQPCWRHSKNLICGLAAYLGILKRGDLENVTRYGSTIRLSKMLPYFATALNQLSRL